MTEQDIYVDHAMLETIVAELRKGAASIESRLSRLESDLKPLQSQWGGRAQTAYQTAHRSWTNTIIEMQQLLVQMAKTADSSNQEYYDADLRGARAFDF
jgi:WXG100 family type VII secretion target